MRHDRAFGFTLVELLVVTSIISLLSSIVIGSVNTARDKAQKARYLQFSTGIKHLNYENIIGEWKFDESGNLAKDYSGNNKNGTIEFGGSYSAAGLSGGGYDTMGSGGYANIPDDPASVPGGAPSILGGGEEVITIDVSFMPRNSNTQGIVSKGSGYILYYRSGTFSGCTNCIRFMIYDENAVHKTFAHPVSWTTNKWHNIVAVYDSVRGKMKVYFDGTELTNPVTNDTPDAPVWNEGIDLQIGFDDYQSGTGMNGIIDEVRVYKSALGLTE